MMGSDMRYGALSAKVHALYGKRLRAAEFAALAERKDPAEILEALRHHPGWSRGLAQAAPEGWSYVGRVEVERALQLGLAVVQLGVPVVDLLLG